MRQILLLLTITILLFVNNAKAQILTNEDSLNAGLKTRSSNASTVLSGYGEAKYTLDKENKTATTNLTRSVLFVGHRFSNKIVFFSELELEDARIEGGKAGGEFSLEQMFLKFDINRTTYLTTGLFIPRLGITNENHLPTTFNGNERPMLEQNLIPSTWREVGVGLYGQIPFITGLNYSLSVTNGLDASKFENGTGIREGRGEGSQASAKNLAFTGALLYYVKNWRLQTSMYYGGSVGLSPRQADSLQLETGVFGTPVMINEINTQYKKYGFSFKALASYISIPEAGSINTAYASNTPSAMAGYYVEFGYDILSKTKFKEKNLIVFSRYETYDLNYKIPKNGITNGTLKQQHIISGFTFYPIKGVAVKLDYRYTKTGNPNPALSINPYPSMTPYLNVRNFYNLGIAYSF